MRRRFHLWAVGANQVIIVEREGREACEQIVKDIATGLGVIAYDEDRNPKGVGSFLAARHVVRFHVETLDEG